MQSTNFSTATHTQAKLRAGETSLEEVIQDHRSRIEARDNRIRAWVTLNEQPIVAEAASHCDLNTGGDSITAWRYGWGQGRD
jgi:Asp-tRNA(Asn)/Glu-tRNA(Gln) amidotransferase A subunit family amidase